MNNTEEKNSPFQGKIAIVTDHITVNEDDFHSADHLIAKYGPGKVVHYTWPANFMAEQKRMIDIVGSLAADKEIRALIINQAVEGSNTAVAKLKETRDDIFVIYCNTNENYSQASALASLIINFDELGMGKAMVEQAKKQGARVFVHYSFPRHMANTTLFKRREIMQEICLKEGLQFVDATAPDPTDDAGLAAARQFILDDVPKMVASYGEDTAFFATTCAQQTPLIKAVVDSHAIYPQPCCPSPFHGFPEALGIETSGAHTDLNYVIGEACRIAEEKNMTDRLSTWPVSVAMMFANAGAEYAIKWINDEVAKTGIEKTVLAGCMSSYIEEVVGEASNIYMTSYSDGNITYDNFKLILMSYLDF